MQGSPEIIDFLNEALAAEVTAINQYFVNSKVCEDWGWGPPGRQDARGVHRGDARR